MSNKLPNKPAASQPGQRLTPPAGSQPTENGAAKPDELAALDAAAAPAITASASTAEQSSSESDELAKLRAELAAKEAELAEREKSLAQEGEALKEMRANIDSSLAARPSTDTGVGLMLADIDLRNAPEEVRRGLHPNATADDKKAYSKWIREHYKGKTPLKSYDVVIKKAKATDIPIRGIKAVDEGDAVRRAFQRAGVAGKTEGYHVAVSQSA